jgi:RNA polymerase sigma-70 factor (ECF subfamily)
LFQHSAELKTGELTLGVGLSRLVPPEDRGMNGETDQLVIERVRSGDPDAFSILVDRYQDRIHSVVLNYVNNRDDAMDIVQDTFLKAYQKLKTFDSASGFYTWLYRVAINTSIDHLRKKRARGVESLDDDKYAQVGFEPVSTDPSVDPERVAIRSEQAAMLRKAVSALSHKLRAVAVLHDVEGLSQEEVAQILGIPTGTVKSRVSRARSELRYALRGLVGEPK